MSLHSKRPVPDFKSQCTAVTAAGALLLVACSQTPTVAQEVAAPDSIGPATVVVSSTVVGLTPTDIGYVMGEDKPGSNVSSWLRYSQMNIARQWWAAEAWPQIPARPDKNWALSDFEAQRTRLRQDPEKQFDWKDYAAQLAKAFGKVPAGTTGTSFVLSELRKMGVAPLIVLSHSTENYPFDTATSDPDWFGRWSYWRGEYINAFYLAKTYDVQRFQLFNEPDGREQKDLQQSDFIRRMQLGSDAIQAALLDVNRIYGKKLTPRISAPVSAGMNAFQARPDRPDTRDSKTGWGQMAMQSRLADFPGRGNYNQGAFQDYAFQNYQKSPEAISSKLPVLMEAISGANGGKPLPVIASEMNVSTAADLSKTSSTLDTPKFYAAFGAIAAAYANAGMSEIYVFRLTQANNFTNGTVKKNGTYIIDNGDPLKNITSSTKGAEAARLFMRGFNGGRTRFAPATASPGLYTLSSRDESNGTYTLMVTNLGASRNVTLDLSPWNLSAGTPVFAEEVSETHHGDIKEIAALPQDGKVALPLSENSIELLTFHPRLASSPTIVPVTPGEQNLSLDAAHSQKLNAMNGQVVLALKALPVALAAAPGPLRLRVYGGAGDLNSAMLLGQITVDQKSGESLVDVTPYISSSNGAALTLRVVPDELLSAGKAFTVQSAEMRVYQQNIAGYPNERDWRKGSLKSEVDEEVGSINY